MPLDPPYYHYLVSCATEAQPTASAGHLAARKRCTTPPIRARWSLPCCPATAWSSPKSGCRDRPLPNDLGVYGRRPHRRCQPRPPGTARIRTRRRGLLPGCAAPGCGTRGYPCPTERSRPPRASPRGPAHRFTFLPANGAGRHSTATSWPARIAPQWACAARCQRLSWSPAGQARPVYALYSLRSTVRVTQSSPPRDHSPPPPDRPSTGRPRSTPPE